MRGSLAPACLGMALAMLTAANTPSQAQYAAQLYPYCSLSTANGATTCYYRSRSECDSPCISNPWYIGARRAWAYTHGGRPLEPRYMPP